MEKKQSSKGLFGKRRAQQDRVETKAALRDYQVLISPVITEKSSLAGSEGNAVVFHVHRKASKSDIKGAVERIYKVQVESVRTCNYQGKMKRTRRSLGRRASFKKAYVSLREGQSIDIVEGL